MKSTLILVVALTATIAAADIAKVSSFTELAQKHC